MAQEKKKRFVGVIQIAISGFAFGFLGVFGKLAFRFDMSVGELLTYRFTLATLLMAIGLALLSPKRMRVSFRDLMICAGLGIFGYAVFSTFYFAALKGVSVATASLLLYTYPILVALGARVVFKQSLSKAQLIALPLALCGLLVLLLGGGLLSAGGAFVNTGRALAHPSALPAVLSGLAAAACYAAYILISSRLQPSIDPLTSGFYVMLFASAGLWVFHQPRWLAFTPPQIEIVFGIAAICTVAPLVLFLSGLQKLRSTEASLLSTIEPVTAAAVGSLLLGETLRWNVWLGGGIVLAALVTTILGGTKANPAEALE